MLVGGDAWILIIVWARHSRRRGRQDAATLTRALIYAGRARFPRAPERADPGEAVPSYQQLRADRAVVEQAATHLRHLAITAAYAGLEHKELAFALADAGLRRSGRWVASLALL